MKNIIMCSVPFEKQVDECYETEYKVTSQITNTYLFDIMNLDTMKLPEGDKETLLVYHGWMMPPEYYSKFYDKCKSFGHQLINTPQQYVACHHFNNWYPMIEDMTPLSIIIERDTIRSMVDQVTAFMVKNDCAVILKDYVKSLKHDWHEACFIPKGAQPLHVAKVVTKFVALKEEYKDFQGNLVVRKFVDLKSIGTHDVSKMPLTKEFRSFVLNGKVIFTSNYWNQGTYSGDLPPQEFIQKVADRIFSKSKSNLFTVDVAQLKDDSWTVIEVGDGQVSAFPDQEDKQKFFSILLG